MIEWLGQLVSWLTLGMVLTLFGIVLMRYFFNTGSIALQESVMVMHALVFMLGAAYTLQHDGHVRVDIFYQHWSPRTRAWVNNLGILLFLVPVCVMILVMSWDYVNSAWAVRETSREAGGLGGVYLLKSVILLMAGLLLLQGLAQFLHNLLIILDDSFGDAPTAPPTHTDTPLL